MMSAPRQEAAGSQILVPARGCTSAVLGRKTTSRQYKTRVKTAAKILPRYNTRNETGTSLRALHCYLKDHWPCWEPCSSQPMQAYSLARVSNKNRS